MGLDARTRPPKPQLLCVDDEPFILEGLRDTLRRSFDVRTATSAAVGLELLNAEPHAYAVVISDMQMPVMAGDAFLREARMVAPTASRILLTGRADIDAALRAVNHAQLFRFLTKPCEPDELLRACASALGQHRLMTAEKVLLEETLRGAVDALVSTLALANPAAFGRADRVKAMVSRVAQSMGLANRWAVEVAAMLAQIGAVTLPQTTAEKLYAGTALTSSEQEMVDRIPAITRQLLAKIPRLEGVLEILEESRGPIPRKKEDGWAALNRVDNGAGLLRVATDFEALQSAGAPADLALTTLAARGTYEPRTLAQFGKVIVGSAPPEVREVPLVELELGMVLIDDVRTPTGGLLVARGRVVDHQLLGRLANVHGEARSARVRVVMPEEAL